MSALRIVSIRFHNFKLFTNFSVALQEMNVFVGPNNAGKSTVISSLRMLEVAIRRARSRNPVRVRLPNGTDGFGHHIDFSQLNVSLENVATNYNEQDSKIEFRLSNKDMLGLFFPSDGGCTLYWETQGTSPMSAGRFSSTFPLVLQVVPVLGPLEHDEPLVSEETVRAELGTHRASRHFRNYWRYFPQDWENFAHLVETTWPGMFIKKPELNISSRTLAMYVAEERIDREVFWSGFGFQIWCQLLTHISRASKSTLLAIDEPEIYLHPDVQRQLLVILRSLGADIVLATHSVEIIGEADPAEILLVQKGKSSGVRLRDIEGVQEAISSIGSVQNVTLAHLARTKKILFVEGADDHKTIRRFAKRLGYTALASGNDLTAFESGGFASWEKVKAFAWGARRTIDANMRIFAVYDRDYYCVAEVAGIQSELCAELTGARILDRKEMENYLLVVSVLERVLDRRIEAKNRRGGAFVCAGRRVADYLEEITQCDRISIQAQYLAKELAFNKGAGTDASTLSERAMLEFESKWNDLATRLWLVPGKSVLAKLRTAIQSDLGINLTMIQIVDEFEDHEIPDDMKSLICELERFRVGQL